MANPITTLQRTAEEFQKKDAKDKRRYILDLVLNNALYILMVIFVVYTAVENRNFLKIGSITNIISQVAAYLPLALGIGGCMVLTCPQVVWLVCLPHCLLLCCRRLIWPADC